MRPRLIAVDDGAGPGGGGRQDRASMRPRLIAVDDRDPHDGDRVGDRASMRPRLIAVDDRRWSPASAAATFGFNEATADRRG